MAFLLQNNITQDSVKTRLSGHWIVNVDFTDRLNLLVN